MNRRDASLLVAAGAAIVSSAIAQGDAIMARHGAAHSSLLFWGTLAGFALQAVLAFAYVAHRTLA